MNGAGQRTLVLPAAAMQNAVGNGNNMNTNQMNYPVMMQVGNSNPPVFYVYQSAEAIVNSPSGTTTANDSQNFGNNPQLGQVLLAPVLPVQNSSSPMIQTVNMRENKTGASRSLGEVFNMQNMSAGQIVSGSNVGASGTGSQSSQSAELATLLSSLQAAGLHLVGSSTSNSTASSVTLPVMSNNVQATDIPVNSLQVAGILMVENNAEKVLSIAFQNRSFEDKSSIVPVCNNSTDKLYQIVDAAGIQDMKNKNVGDPVILSLR